MSNLLTIKNLQAKIGDKTILNGVNLSIKPGEIHALLGPNGSGKSSLAKLLLGYDTYQLVTGDIKFAGKDLTKLKIEERVELGLALSDQNPPTIKGVSLETLLTIISENDLDEFFPLEEKLRQKPLAQLAATNQKLFARQINDKLSGGEKKLSELFQIIALKPKLVIFDELDSGLDLDNLNKITQVIKDRLIKTKTALLFITHAGSILELFKPDYTHVLLDGKIVCTHQDFQQVLTTIREHGYEQCKQCPFLAGRSSD